jgi:hypothetical protein
MSQEDILSKDPLIPGTITRARKFGEALRESKDPVTALENFFGPDFHRGIDPYCPGGIGRV